MYVTFGRISNYLSSTDVMEDIWPFYFCIFWIYSITCILFSFILSQMGIQNDLDPRINCVILSTIFKREAERSTRYCNYLFFVLVNNICCLL